MDTTRFIQKWLCKVKKHQVQNTVQKASRVKFQEEIEKKSCEKVRNMKNIKNLKKIKITKNIEIVHWQSHKTEKTVIIDRTYYKWKIEETI